MKVAVIDIGTNTFHLLIADQENKSLIFHREKVAVRLGMGGISEGVIADDAIDRAIATLIDFKLTIDKLSVDEIAVTATSAVRSAGNQKEFVDLVYEKAGLEINVLVGEVEAALIHKGVSEFVEFNNDTGLIMDIGGGSIEFIIADRQEVKWLKSYELGGQRLIDRFHKSDPISITERKLLASFLTQAFIEVFEACKKFKATLLIGSSGSFDTFWDMHAFQADFTPSKKPSLSVETFKGIHENLMGKNREERLALPGMIPLRVDMIVSASIAVDVVMENCEFSIIKVSPFALKEGVLYHGLPKTK